MDDARSLLTCSTLQAIVYWIAKLLVNVFHDPPQKIVWGDASFLCISLKWLCQQYIADMHLTISTDNLLGHWWRWSFRVFTNGVLCTAFSFPDEHFWMCWSLSQLKIEALFVLEWELLFPETFLDERAWKEDLKGNFFEEQKALEIILGCFFLDSVAFECAGEVATELCSEDDGRLVHCSKMLLYKERTCFSRFATSSSRERVLEVLPIALSSNIRIDRSCFKRNCSCSIWQKERQKS